MSAQALPLLQEPPESAFAHPGRWWHRQGERIVCDLCPRACSLNEGDRGFCFVRQHRNGQMVLTTYGRSTGFCIDPIEKKPLNHFLPGTSVLSFGTAGCNLGCKFCQNWDISKSRSIEQLSSAASPEAIAVAAKTLGCHSVAFTYNDPVIWAEYAIDTAHACHAQGIKTVAVTAGYITPEAREAFYRVMDAANVDLKGFSETFYHKLTLSHLEPVLDTLRWLKAETDVWFEITNLIIPNANDQPDELKRLCDWILRYVGDTVPVHFTAFHPDYRLRDRPDTPPETLQQARSLAQGLGLQYVYTGNVNDVERQSTYCSGCQQVLIERNQYALGIYALEGNACRHCGQTIPGVFAAAPGSWGRRRQPVDMRPFQQATLSSSTHPRTTSMANATANPPPLVQLTEEQQQRLLVYTASVIKAACLETTPRDDLGDLEELPVMGVYVSLKRRGRLRGCCGSFGKAGSLGGVLRDAAQRTTQEDPRFPPVSRIELAHLDLEVWLLFGGDRITEEGEARIQAITVGRHGLGVVREQNRGLLLPGVAVENQWDAEEFLNQVCIKAQLPPSAWREANTQLRRFEGVAYQGRILSETEARAYPPTGLLYDLDQLSTCTQFYTQALGALVAGQTPELVCATVPDQTVHGVIVNIRTPDGRELSASRLEPRAVFPLQATLGQLCQRMAEHLRTVSQPGSYGFDLTLLYDPALHGTVAEPDLAGLEPRERAIYVLERNRSCLIYHAEASVEDLFNRTVQLAQVRETQQAVVVSFQAQSTRSVTAVQSIPVPRSGPEIRPPAVAGKFYPADPAELQQALDPLLDGEVERRPATAALVPHAGWRFCGKLAGEVLKRIEWPRTVIVLSPKHTRLGVDWAVAPHQTWAFPGGRVASNANLAKRLSEAIPGLLLDAGAHREEHGIEVELPLIARLAPETQVVGITIGYGNLEQCDRVAAGLATVLAELEEIPLLLISSDMNHFASDTQTRALDTVALEALEQLDPDALFHTVRRQHISMCGLLPAVVVLKTLHRLDRLKQAERVGYATTADVTGDPNRVVGYAGMLFTG